MGRNLIRISAEFQNRPRQSLPQSFVRAFTGLGYMVATERNAQIHCAVAILWFLLNMVVRPTTGVVVEGGIAVFMVMGLEAVNTSLERVTDMAVSGEWRTLAGHAKDTAAGGVLLATVAAVLVGIHVMAAAWPWHWWLFTENHWLGAVISGVGLLFVLTMCLSAWCQRRANWRSSPSEGHLI